MAERMQVRLVNVEFLRPGPPIVVAGVDPSLPPMLAAQEVLPVLRQRGQPATQLLRQRQVQIHDARVEQ